MVPRGSMMAPRSPVHGAAAQRLQCLLGLFVFILIAYAIGRWRVWRSGEPRTRMPWRVLLWGVALQFVFAGIVLWTPWILQTVNEVVNALLGFTRAGAAMVFGHLADHGGSPVTATPGGPVIGYAQTGAYFAFFVLPTIVFFSM